VKRELSIEKMKKYCLFVFSSVLFCFSGCVQKIRDQVVNEAERVKPNILLIYADDVGMGDIGAYGSKLIRTPHIDALAEGGIRFTSAYATSAMCTPSRYSLLTGIYAFRLEGAGILSAEDPLLIRPGSVTLPGMLRENGYRTAIVGKWHLGLGETVGGLDWNGAIKPGPLEVGFDESFLLPVTNDRVPTVYLDGHFVYKLNPNEDPIHIRYPEEGHHAFQEEQFGKQSPAAYKPLVGNLPTGLSHPELLRYGADTQHAGTIVNGVSRIGHMSGGRTAWWDDEEMTFVFAEKAGDFIRQNTDNPFFLFLSMHQNHVPRIPNPRFAGTSGVGLRGDCVVELDWIVGELVRILKETGQLENTLVVFSSDNGPVLYDGYDDGALEDHNDHDPNGGFRGGKYIAYEGGTRMPTIAYWPTGIMPGIVSDALISQVDFLATFASLAGGNLPDDRFDSQDVLPALLGESSEGNDFVIQQSSDGLGIRQGKWKYIEATTRSAWAYNRHNLGERNAMHIEMLQPVEYLFDLEADPGERNNLAGKNPQKLKELKELLQSVKAKPIVP
jgi:arylsulfatase A